MADKPDGLVLKRHRDLEGRRGQAWIRRFLVLLVGGLVVAGVANAFGQRPTTSIGRSDAAQLKVYSPSRVRGGLYYESRFHIDAHRELKKATLVLSSGWLEGMTLNTLEPSPLGEADRNGALALELGHIPAGKRYLFFMQFQVNPTNVGRRKQVVELWDGDERLVRIERTMTVWP